MRSYVLSGPAEADLVAIFQYTEDVWGRHRAAAYLHELYMGIQHLAAFPEAGRLRPELASNVRSWRVGQHVIFYAPQADQVAIVRVLHGAADFSHRL